MQLPEGMTVEEALTIYRNDPNVEYAEPNYLRHAMSTIPDDVFFPNLWGLNNTGQVVNNTPGTSGADIDAPEAWDITTGSSSVVVAVIDTGVDYNHPDLTSNIWTNPGEIPDNGIDDDGNGKIDDVNGWDFVNDDNDPIDGAEHGTHVAGTIAAEGNNSIGIAGVSWTAKIMPLRFLDGFGDGKVSDSIAAIDYAIANGAHIINASYGWNTFSQFEREAISRARDAGILFVVAAGNESENNDLVPSYPASHELDNIIAVAATDQNDNLTDFSNYGATSVDVAAPGENIYSAYPVREEVWEDDFDDGDISDWTLNGCSNTTWDFTNSYAYSAPNSLADSPGGNYQNNIESCARAPVVDLSSKNGVKLEFWLFGSSEEAVDLLRVQTSTDLAQWRNQPVVVQDPDTLEELLFDDGISGSTDGKWVHCSVDLGGYDRKSPVHIRFYFTSNNSGDDIGWYMDDVTVTAVSSSFYDTDTEYEYLDGTSMAAPHVSGIAALIKAQNPSWTYKKIKPAIESSVNPVSSLSGKVVTGGRVNALNALVPPPAPDSLSAEATSASQIVLIWVDNSPNETEFRIERKEGAEGTYSEVTTVGANVTSYSDTALSSGTTYWYRLLAHNLTGNSAYSNEANATTLVIYSGGGGGG
jgi:subtilisin family serine protease